MQAIIAISTLLIGMAVILIGNGLLGILLGTRGALAGFSAATMGLIMSGYFLGFILGTFWVPRLIRRVGHIRLFAAVASMASVIAMAHGLWVDAGFWFFLRLLSGVCVVGLYISIESWLNQQSSNEQRGHIFSVYMTMTMVGLGIGQFMLLAGDPMDLNLFAVAAIFLSIGLIPVALTRVAEPTMGQPSRLTIGQLYGISPLGTVGVVLAGLGSGAFWGLGPVFGQKIGLPSLGIAMYTGMTILGGVLFIWPVGKFSDSRERRKVLLWVCLVASLMATASWALLLISWEWMLLGAFAYGAFAFSIYGLSVAHTNDYLDHSQMLEATTGMQLLWGLGATVGPVMVGWFMQITGDPRSFLLFLAIAALVPAGFAAWRMNVRPALPPGEQSDYVILAGTSSGVIGVYGEEYDFEEDSESR